MIGSPTDVVSYTPVPCICSGVITSKLTDTETYEVSIYESPLGELNGPVYCALIYSPGHDGDYKQGDRVKVQIFFTFGGAENKFLDVATGMNNYIIGRFNERSLANIKVENPISAEVIDAIRFINEKSGSGIVANDNGQVTLATSGVINSILKPFGHGVYENLSRTYAQNHQRVISHNPPFYFAREYFGMYSGADVNDKASRISENDHLISYRRFVTQTRSPDNWVSSCEGAYSPWVGANIDSEEVDKGKDVLFSKAINFEDSRATIEIGEPGDSFINVRVDDVKVSEKNVPASPGATPAILGNRFKMLINDKGELDLRVAGKGVPSSNLNAFHMSIDSDGNLTIHSKGKITFSHSEDDEENNSIVMDPKNGIDITALNGLRVNGQEVVLKAFVEFLKQYQAQWCQVTAIGGPAPIHPAIAPEFNSNVTKFGEKGGFTSVGKSTPAKGIIKDTDDFESI